MVSNGVTGPPTDFRTAVSETRVQDPSIAPSCILANKSPSLIVRRDGNTWAMDAVLKATLGSSFGSAVEGIHNPIDPVFFKLQKVGVFECM